MSCSVIERQLRDHVRSRLNYVVEAGTACAEDSSWSGKILAPTQLCAQYRRDLRKTSFTRSLTLLPNSLYTEMYDVGVLQIATRKEEIVIVKTIGEEMTCRCYQIIFDRSFSGFGNVMDFYWWGSRAVSDFCSGEKRDSHD